MAKQLICSACGYVGSAKRAVKGSLGVEILLWLFFLIPGFIYTVWRQSTKHKACPVCGSTNLIPIDSPVGQKLLKEQGKTVEQVQAESVNDGWPSKRKILIGVAVLLTLSIGFFFFVSTVSPERSSADPAPVDFSVASTPEAQAVAQYSNVFGSTVLPFLTSATHDIVAALNAEKDGDLVTALRKAQDAQGEIATGKKGFDTLPAAPRQDWAQLSVIFGKEIDSYSHAADMLVTGIKNRDATIIREAETYIDQGVTYANQATALMAKM